jgi:subtilisin family serine protease
VRRTLALLPLIAALAVPTTAAADEIIVKREPGLDRAERLALRADADVQFVDTLTLVDTEVVAPKPGESQAEALAALNADPDVVYAEPNVLVTPQSEDTWYSQLWSLDAINGPAAWVTTRGAGAAVAVVDTGIDTTHADLAGQFTGNPGERGAGKETNGVDDDHNGFTDDWQGWDFVNGDNTIETQGNAHGTHVTGTIAAIADNHVGVAGVAPQAQIVPVKVFGAPGTGAPLSRIADAFDYAGDLGSPVVNASLGGAGSSSTINAVIAAHPSTLYVVAAGNDSRDAANSTPCNAPGDNVVCVGATDNLDRPADFSNYSATAVDLFAPGEDILSTLPGGG